MRGLINRINIDFADIIISIYKFADLTARQKDGSVYHCHSFYELHFALENTHIFSDDNNKIIIPKNSMLIIKPEEYHFSDSDEQEAEKKKHIYITISKKKDEKGFFKRVEEALEKYNMKPKIVSYKLMEAVNMFTVMEFNTEREQYLQKMAAEKFLYLLLDEINVFKDDINYDLVDIFENKSAILGTLINKQEYKLKDIAQLLNYSPRHTARLIKQIYGVSFRELRNRQMLDMAKKTLKDNKKITISEIALMSGYNNVYGFNKKFKEYVGCTPKEYREKNKLKKEENNK